MLSTIFLFLFKEFGDTLNKEKMIVQTKEFVSETLKGEASGHDWWHIYRVTETAKIIAKQEKADVFICEMAALLHDIADEKLNTSEEEGIRKVKEWLSSINLDEKTTMRIVEIITMMSYKGGGQPPMKTIEGMVVQDADRLDAIGAIGIARAFAFSGAKGQIIFDPNIKHNVNVTKEEYRKRKTTAINHFYEKLLKLKDLMNTDYGKLMAVKRHEYMEHFLQTFYEEWEGKQ